MRLLGILAAWLILWNGAPAQTLPPIQTVFVVVMENADWGMISGSSNAPFINTVILPMASYCGAYTTFPWLRPSLPNYLWLEAGTNFGVFNDNDPAYNHQATTNHLVTQLSNAGISWRSYQEDIDGTYVPLTSTNGYAPRHNPVVYFDDVTGTNSPSYPYGIEHIRPFTEFLRDLTNNAVARYNFLTPNVCHDMHDSCWPLYNVIRQGDDWLAGVVPLIQSSSSYQQGGALFILWDEPADGSSTNMGMILLSPFAMGGGYRCDDPHTHSSLLRTLQEIFHVGPLLGDAANATNLSDLFAIPRLTSIAVNAASVSLQATGVLPNKSVVFEVSTNLTAWAPFSTNYTASNSVSVVDASGRNVSARFYRVRQLP